MTLGHGEASQLLGRGPLHDQVTHLGRQVNQLVDAQAATVSGPLAVVAALGLQPSRLAPREQAGGGSLGRGQLGALDTRFASLRAALTEPAHQTLGLDAAHRRSHQKRLDTHVDKARERADRVIGVQRRKHQVAGER
ncbi:hypothetical protein D3C72_1972710 [compost metagenome]